MSKLIQLNIEGDRHLDLVQAFLKEQDPDIICLEEVFEDDISRITSLPHHAFLPMMRKEKQTGMTGVWGTAVCSREKITDASIEYYHKPTRELVLFDTSTMEKRRATQRFGLLVATLPHGLNIGVVHHTWTPDGAVPNEYQIADTRALIDLIQKINPDIVCGDFNIPREQNYLYADMSSHFEDCIPRSIRHSLYVPLHNAHADPVRASYIGKFMVDYIFRVTERYVVSGVEQHCGMSDHCAFVAHISE